MMKQSAALTDCGGGSYSPHEGVHELKPPANAEQRSERPVCNVRASCTKAGKDAAKARVGELVQKLRTRASEVRSWK